MIGASVWTRALLLAGAALTTSSAAQAEEPAHRLHRAEDRHLPQLGTDMVNGFQMYLDEHNGELGGAKVKFIVEDDQGKPDVDVTKAKKLILQDKVDMLVGGVLASTGYALAPVATARKDALHRLRLDRRRSRAAAGRQISLSRAHRLVPSQPNHPLGAMGLRPGLQAHRRDRRRLRLRLRAARRLPEGVRGLRRQDRAEDLAADRHQGFRALHSDAQERRRRHLHADGRADVAAIPQAAARLRQQEADRRRRHQL